MSSFFFQAEDGIRDWSVTGVQTCALPISPGTLITGEASKLYSMRSSFERGFSSRKMPADSPFENGSTMTRHDPLRFIEVRPGMLAISVDSTGAAKQEGARRSTSRNHLMVG